LSRPKFMNNEIGKLRLFFPFLFFTLCLTALAWSSSPIIRVKILEQKESVSIGASGPYRIENEKGKKQFYPSSTLLRRIEATSSGIKVDGIIWGKEVWIKPEKSGSLALVVIKGDKRRYRGDLLVKEEEGFLRVINQLPLEEYLYGVLKWEVSPGWPLAALCAQAIAARTYALKKIESSLFQDQLHHLSATVDDQVYGGFESEDLRVQEAVNFTRGKVITYQGELIEAFYHNCCGGYTVSSKDVWGGEDLPYLRVGPDKFCQKSPHYHWEWEIKRSELRKILFKEGFSVGIIYRLEVFSRAQDLSFKEGGRVTKLCLEHQGGRLYLTGTEFRKLIEKWIGSGKLKSTLFDEVKLQVKGGASYFVFQGRGAGHGVGMCQWGVKEMAEQGYNFEEILQFYYPGTKIEKRYY